jgi:hypothetical protein
MASEAAEQGLADRRVGCAHPRQKPKALGRQTLHQTGPGRHALPRHRPKEVSMATPHGNTKAMLCFETTAPCPRGASPKQAMLDA